MDSGLLHGSAWWGSNITITWSHAERFQDTTVKFNVKLTFWMHRTAVSRVGKGEGRDTARNRGKGKGAGFSWRHSLTGLVRTKNDVKRDLGLPRSCWAPSQLCECTRHPTHLTCLQLHVLPKRAPRSIVMLQCSWQTRTLRAASYPSPH